MVNRISDSVINIPYSSNKTIEVESVVVAVSTTDTPISKESTNLEQLSVEKAKKMTNSMNKFLELTNTELRFKYHDELETYYVTLINSKTEEVVREIPSKKLMDMYAAMCEFVGILVDKKI